MRSRPLLAPLVIGLLGLALWMVELARDPRRALFAYTAAVLAALSVAVGALVLVMIAHTVGARWFVVLRPLTGAMAATLPVFLVLFAPIALGVRSLYPWAGPRDELDLAQRAWADHARPWLDVPFFVARSYAYLLVWSAIALVLPRRERVVSAAGLPVMALTVTFAAFDWIMSLDARWSSDIFGLYLFAGGFGGAIGVTCVVAWLARRAKVLPAEVRPDHFHALGRVALVAVMFWAYIAFCQLLLVWIADMERESSFFLARSQGGWGLVSAALVVAHFAVPFSLLLSRSLKRSPAALAFVGAWLVSAHVLDVYWLVLPPLHRGMQWLDLAALVGVAGVCSSFGAWRFLAARPVPAGDPLLAESLRYESS